MVKNINTKISQQWRLAEITGYQPVTDYWDRFGESEELGVSGVFECYTELLDESKGNCRKITELATVISHKAHEIDADLANPVIVRILTVEDIEELENLVLAYNNLYNITKMIALETLECNEKMRFLSEID